MKIKNDKQLNAKEQELLRKTAQSKIAKEAVKLALDIAEYKIHLANLKQTDVVEPEVKEELSFADQVMRDRLMNTNNILLVKGKEYVRGSDRHHNFRRAGEMERTNMPRALHGMLQKHIVNYYDMLDDIDKGIVHSDAMINERFGDIVTYFVLQESCIKQHNREKQNTCNK